MKFTFRALQNVASLINVVGYTVPPNEEGMRYVDRTCGTPPAPIQYPNSMAAKPTPLTPEDFPGLGKLSTKMQAEPQKYTEATDWITVDRTDEDGKDTGKGWIPVYLVSHLGQKGQKIFTAEELIPALETKDNEELKKYLDEVFSGAIEQKWRYGM